MDTRKEPQVGRLFRGALVLTLLTIIGTLSAQEYVVMRGQVIVPAHVRTPVDLTMDVGDTSCVRVELYGRGKFLIETKDTERYLLRFEQEGSISKTVEVNTRFAERRVGSTKRVVEFDVQLAPVDTVVPLRYAGPVGKIKFHHSNGRMAIERDREMVSPAVKEWRGPLEDGAPD